MLKVPFPAPEFKPVPVTEQTVLAMLDLMIQTKLNQAALVLDVNLEELFEE